MTTFYLKSVDIKKGILRITRK